MRSALYFGTVRHRRREPILHAFRYRTFWVYLDLFELDSVFKGRWLWSTKRFSLAWFRRRDHFGDPSRPLDACVRDLVRERLKIDVNGPIRILTHLRYFGYVQNPVSFYYCFAENGEDLLAVVAEVTNTPWSQRYCYALRATDEAGNAVQKITSTFRKALHVSPFMAMDQDYRWRFMKPSERLTVHMENLEKGRCLFDATMTLTRKPISTKSLAMAWLLHPMMTMKVLFGIYWQALLLHLKRCPRHRNPDRLRRGET